MKSDLFTKSLVELLVRQAELLQNASYTQEDGLTINKQGVSASRFEARKEVLEHVKN